MARRSDGVDCIPVVSRRDAVAAPGDGGLPASTPLRPERRQETHGREPGTPRARLDPTCQEAEGGDHHHRQLDGRQSIRRVTVPDAEAEGGVRQPGTGQAAPTRGSSRAQPAATTTRNTTISVAVRRIIFPLLRRSRAMIVPAPHSVKAPRCHPRSSPGVLRGGEEVRWSADHGSGQATALTTELRNALPPEGRRPAGSGDHFPAVFGGRPSDVGGELDREPGPGGHPRRVRRGAR
jgi:hypothetical protein